MADTTEVPAATEVADSSIAEHEAAFMEGPSPAPKADADADASKPAAESSIRTRDKSGKFQAKSRTPEPAAEPVTKTEPAEPVETLDTLRERLRARDAELDALKRAPRMPESPAAVRPAEPAAAEPVAPRAGKFPKFEEWAALKGNEAKDFDDFLDEREDYGYRLRRETERAEEAAKSAAEALQKHVTAFAEQLPAVKKDHPDYDTLAADPERAQTSKVMEIAALEVGPRATYYLLSHDDERRELTTETLYVSPENPAFPATVAAMKRYLKTLIAAETAPAEPKPVATRPTLVPRPPSPTKTGGMPPSDEPPDDDAASIAAHEAYYGPKSRRH